MENSIKPTTPSKSLLVLKRVRRIVNMLMLGIGWFSFLVIATFYTWGRINQLRIPIPRNNNVQQVISQTPSFFISPTTQTTGGSSTTPSVIPTLEIPSDANSKTYVYPSREQSMFTFSYPKDWIIVEDIAFPEGGPAPTSISFYKPHVIQDIESSMYQYASVEMNIIQQSQDFNWYDAWYPEIFECNNNGYDSGGHETGKIFSVIVDGINGVACSVDMTYHIQTTVLLNRNNSLVVKMVFETPAYSIINSQEELVASNQAIRQILLTSRIYED